MTFTQITVTQDYDYADGLDPAGTVSFTPTAAMVNGGVLVAAAKVTKALDIDGALSVALFANTDPTTAPAGVGYLVEENVGGAVRSYYVQVPHNAGPTVVLSSLATLADPPALSWPSQLLGPEDLLGVSQSGARVGDVLTATAVTSPGTGAADVTGWTVKPGAYVPPAWTNQAGRYMHPVSPNDQTTSATMTNGTLRLAPWVLPFPVTIDRIGTVITVVGDVGSKVRLGIYSDNGACYPGVPLLDAGQIAGDSATAQDITVSQVLPAGLYWIGGASQSVTTTPPTVEVTNDWTPPVPLLLGTSSPAAATTSVGYTMTGVTGALPTFSSTVTPIGSVPRVRVRLG